MQAVLSLDDGGWSRCEEDMPVGIIRQPLPPSVLAQVQPVLHPIPPSKVADPRPGPAKPLEDGTQSPIHFKICIL